MTHAQEIANTIFEQLGGKAGMGFATVTGSRNFTAITDAKGRPGLRFSLCKDLKDYIPTAKVVPNRCTVYLNEGADDYDMVFERYTPGRYRFDYKTGKVFTYPEKCVVTSSHEGIYCSDLQPTFEERTGLILDFCRVRWTA